MNKNKERLEFTIKNYVLDSLDNEIRELITPLNLSVLIKHTINNLDNDINTLIEISKVKDSEAKK